MSTAVTLTFPCGKPYRVVEKRASAVAFEVLVPADLPMSALHHGHGFPTIPFRLRRFLGALGFTVIVLCGETPFEADKHKIWRIEFQR